MSTNPKIIFEDDNLLVLDKPAGLTVHEGSGVRGRTLVDWLLSYLGKTATGLERGGLVHRLDKDTSGIILVAKNPDWYKYLKSLFKQHQIKKTYTALVHGQLSPDSGRIDIAVARDIVNRTKFRPVRVGRESVTNYEVQKYLKGYTLVTAKPLTGRTHQIRVHFSAIGFPIAGDYLYGAPQSKLTRQFLHASGIEFVSPTGSKLKFASPLPLELQNFLDDIR